MGQKEGASGSKLPTVLTEGEPPIWLVLVASWVFWPAGLYFAVQRLRGDAQAGRRTSPLTYASIVLVALLAVSTIVVVPVVLAGRSG